MVAQALPLPRPVRNVACAHRRPLLQRPPERWLELITALPAEIQSEIACMIWWDFFSQRISGRHWPHLDGLINRPFASAPRERQIVALMQCGYSRPMAEGRTRHGRK